MTGKVSDDAPWVEVKIPKPEGRIDIGGRLMVVISVEEWDRVVDTLQDYADAIEVQEMMDDPTEKSIPWEEVRKELFANNIKKVRKRGKITQKELAKRLRVSQARVSQIENLDHRPTMKVYKKVAKALGCKVEELIWQIGIR